MEIQNDNAKIIWQIRNVDDRSRAPPFKFKHIIEVISNI